MKRRNFILYSLTSFFFGFKINLNEKDVKFTKYQGWTVLESDKRYLENLIN